jgi:hypothetical protein
VTIFGLFEAPERRRKSASVAGITRYMRCISTAYINFLIYLVPNNATEYNARDIDGFLEERN